MSADTDRGKGVKAPARPARRCGGYRPNLEPSTTWLAGGAVSVTGAPYVTVAFSAPFLELLGAVNATSSGVLVSVRYPVLPSVRPLSVSTRRPSRVMTPPLVMSSFFPSVENIRDRSHADASGPRVLP